jgi:hypothetical protein
MVHAVREVLRGKSYLSQGLSRDAIVEPDGSVSQVSDDGTAWRQEQRGARQVCRQEPHGGCLVEATDNQTAVDKPSALHPPSIATLFVLTVPEAAEAK